ncbi:ATP-binding protein [Geodermatophilus chilensis]|uniref:ATP-binding protein n=1 Tax=Geodermatophilus chilensis TaxID=2035835 RepID=UPI000C255F7B|nr:AAA family ATPase [Geodermatophilus chilensis]
MSTPLEELVGRDRMLARLRKMVGRVVDGHRSTVLVAGEAGIGKTSLLHAAVAIASSGGARTAWGTCIDVDGAPGYWPWTQALDGLVRALGVDRAIQDAAEDVPLLAAFIPSFPEAPAPIESDERSRLLAMDATARFLEAVATTQPLVLVVDDLQWADESSLALFDFLARAPRSARIGLVGAYRHDELSPAAGRRLGELIPRSEHLQVGGLDIDAVHRLVERVADEPVDRTTVEAIHRRAGGHPFFVRELAALAQGRDTDRHLPAAVRDAINRRLGQLSPMTVTVLETAAVAGPVLLVDVLATALDRSLLDVESAIRTAVEVGVVVRRNDGLRFRHDLLRETLLDRVDLARRITLHRALGEALEARLRRGVHVPPSDLARHFIAAIGVDGPDRAVRWALEAAASERVALAFEEAAGHLRRLRAAAADAAVPIDKRQLTDVLLAEADALARAGMSVDARGLLRHAEDVAADVADPERIARVALATAQLGAKFAARRDEIIRQLEGALAAVSGLDEVWEARVTATLARELQHSVTEDRPRAWPLSERALDLGRRTEDPGTLLTCLLARHDVLWTPGAEQRRAEIAREIVAVAQGTDDQERHAEGLILLANALLETGSLAFEAALDAGLAILDSLGQPRHRYLAQTRRACLALLRGALEEAEQRLEEAAALGERIREPDTGNVRLSQRLELVRARGDPGELREFARAAVEHWTGAPVHAHAVAAGFSARAGELDDARHHVAAVLDLGT